MEVLLKKELFASQKLMMKNKITMVCDVPDCKNQATIKENEKNYCSKCALKKFLERKNNETNRK